MIPIDINKLSVLKQFDLIIKFELLIILLEPLIMLKYMNAALLLRLKSHYIFLSVFENHCYTMCFMASSCVQVSYWFILLVKVSMPLIPKRMAEL